MMVCLGNICRSPMAHGILDRRIADQGLSWEVASSGTSAYHIGELPDSRSVKVCQENGLDITYQRAQKFEKGDLDTYDLIVAMDSSNHSNIIKLCDSDEQKRKVKLLLNYAHPDENRQVPDPYYTGSFQAVYDMIEEAVDALVQSHNRV